MSPMSGVIGGNTGFGAGSLEMTVHPPPEMVVEVSGTRLVLFSSAWAKKAGPIPQSIRDTRQTFISWFFEFRMARFCWYDPFIAT